MTRPPVPPFTAETAATKVRLAEDAWNTRDPAVVARDYTPDSHWRQRAEFVTGRGEIEALLARKWAHELEYRLIRELFVFGGNRIAAWRRSAGVTVGMLERYPLVTNEPNRHDCIAIATHEAS